MEKMSEFLKFPMAAGSAADRPTGPTSPTGPTIAGTGAITDFFRTFYGKALV